MVRSAESVRTEGCAAPNGDAPPEGETAIVPDVRHDNRGTRPEVILIGHAGALGASGTQGGGIEPEARFHTRPWGCAPNHVGNQGQHNLHGGGEGTFRCCPLQIGHGCGSGQER